MLSSIMASFVAYYRVSTERQGKSGLGLAAQKRKIEQFLTPPDQLIGEFCDIQSGRRDNRVELAKALALAKREAAKLIIARLDRFSRRVSFIANIMEQGISLCCAEMPNASDFQLHIFAALAQEERRLISERTKAALAEANGEVRFLAPTEGIWPSGIASTLMNSQYHSRQIRMQVLSGFHTAR